MFFILDFTQIFWTDLSNITFNFLIYYLLATGKVGVLFLNQQVDILVVIYIMTWNTPIVIYCIYVDVSWLPV